jgi:hypothetical protein
MSPVEVHLEGTLKADGTLELDQKPGLTPGRVLVTVKPLMTPARPGLAEVLQRIRREQQVRGFVGPGEQEVAFEEDARREEDREYERRWETIWSRTQSGPPT